MTCDLCDVEAAWLAFAAYDIEPTAAHLRVARYPAPMIRACAEHFTVMLADDADAPGSTGQWIVKPT